jgi:hypothetical protein
MKSLLTKFILSFILLSISYLQAADSFDDYIQCRRDTEVRTLLPKSNGLDPCIGSVVIQGIAYECGKQADTNRLVQEFLQKLTAKAKERCEDFCKDRAKGCHGKFTSPDQCGFTVPEDRALEYGKTLGKCNPKCGGQAFIYCSIYHAETLRYHEEFFQDKTPNCYCER